MYREGGTPINATVMVDRYESSYSIRLYKRPDTTVQLVGFVSGPRPAGQRDPSVEFNIDPNDPFKCEVTYNVDEADFESDGPIINGRRPADRVVWQITRRLQLEHNYLGHHHGPVDIPRSSRSATVSCPRFHWDQYYQVELYVGRTNTGSYPPIMPIAPIHSATDSYRTPPQPGPPPPGEPTVTRCGHVAIVPTMPRALSGGEDAADHWIRISNPGAASISVTVDGRDRAGTKGGTYRRELPAYRSVIGRIL